MTVSLIGIQGEQIWTINSGEDVDQDSFDWSSTRRHRSELEGSIYERAINQGGHLVIEDLSKVRKRTQIEDRLIEQGVKREYPFQNLASHVIGYTAAPEKSDIKDNP